MGWIRRSLCSDGMLFEGNEANGKWMTILLILWVGGTMIKAGSLDGEVREKLE